MDSEHKLLEEQLPAQKDFFNDLTRAACSDLDYAIAKKAWSEFRCNTMKDYMMNYLKMDIHQLADVFEYFRQLVRSEDGLDAVNFFGIPGLLPFLILYNI